MDGDAGRPYPRAVLDTKFCSTEPSTTTQVSQTTNNDAYTAELNTLSASVPGTTRTCDLGITNRHISWMLGVS